MPVPPGFLKGHFHDVHCRRTMIYDVVMVEFEELREQTNLLGIDFLMTEIAAGCTFLDVADTTGVEETRIRNRKNAQTAYDTIQRLRSRVTMSPAQLDAFSTRLKTLKRRLLDAGTMQDPE
jgi:hypothetical protein